MEESSSSSSSSSSSADADFYTYPSCNSSMVANNLVNHSTTATSLSSSSSSSYQTLASILRFLHTSLTNFLYDYSPIPFPSLIRVNSSTSSLTSTNNLNNGGEVSIRIISGEEHNQLLQESDDHGNDGEITSEDDSGGGHSNRFGTSSSTGNGERDLSSSSTYEHQYDLQQGARWIEQIIPFSLLLLIVFIREHLQVFFVTVAITAFIFRSNDILRKQTSLKGERRLFVLVGYFIVFILHVIGIYWLYRNDDLLSPLLMIPPKAVPPFWHAIFIILVNDTMVRQAAMAFKLVLLIYYKNGRGDNFRRQGHMLTIVEYTLLLYRALIPMPVWSRFYLNKDYGSLFSSLTTGLYLTFKLTLLVEKVRSFFSALKALSRKEVLYGSYATPEQLNEAGDLCAICQEKMHIPVVLCCKHIFCKECASEWFERERTCPLCRALIRPAKMRSYGDGSTNLFVQLF